MKKLSPFGDAGRRYEAAHQAHYSARDLPLALDLYQGVLTAHPRSTEAGFSRTQIQNIANSVIPPQALLDAQISLIVAHFSRTS